MTDLCLVTGGAGFIGSHTVDLLVERGYQVRVLDSLQPRVHPTGAPSWLSPSAEFVQGDVTDATVMREVLEGVQSVIHLAAYQDYMPDFSRFIHTNTESAALIFEIAVSDPARYPVQKVVFASSQAVCGEGRYVCTRCAGGVDAPSIAEQLAQPSLAYGFPPDAVHMPAPRSMEQLRRGDWSVRCPKCGEALSPLLIDELTVSPGTAYGISKYAIELLADRLGRRYQIPTACMRYTYVQGPRNSFHNPYSGIARRFVLRLLDGLPPIIYEDGAQLRDYVNVRDVARANVLVLEDERSKFQGIQCGRWSRHSCARSRRDPHCGIRKRLACRCSRRLPRRRHSAHSVRHQRTASSGLDPNNLDRGQPGGVRRMGAAAGWRNGADRRNGTDHPRPGRHSSAPTQSDS